MIPLSHTDLQILIAASTFVLGTLSVLVGIFVLISRGNNSQIRALATHTARMAKKGLSEELTGLLTSASDLAAALSQLVRTAAGIGIFLITFGLAMIAASYWVVQQIEWAIV
jgi:hypothetical protein